MVKTEETVVKCDKTQCSPEYHASLVSEIKTRMKLIRDTYTDEKNELVKQKDE